jgi:alkylated DNA repair dioxygenase AlkB
MEEDEPFQVDEDGKYVLTFAVAFPKVIDSDGAIVRYAPHYIPPQKALEIFKRLKKYEGDADHAQGITPAGKPYIAERKTLQVSDVGVRAYKFNGATASETEPFSKYPEIQRLRTKVYEDTGDWCNFCLYNAYTPEAKLGWHSDSEKDMVEGSTIISLSFGDVRRFRIRRKDNHNIVKELYLESGSLLTMEGECQKIMDHSVWDMTKKELDTSVVHGLRINLTFRVMKPKE